MALQRTLFSAYWHICITSLWRMAVDGVALYQGLAILSEEEISIHRLEWTPSEGGAIKEVRYIGGVLVIVVDSANTRSPVRIGLRCIHSHCFNTSTNNDCYYLVTNFSFQVSNMPLILLLCFN